MIRFTSLFERGIENDEMRESVRLRCTQMVEKEHLGEKKPQIHIRAMGNSFSSECGFDTSLISRASWLQTGRLQ